MTSNFNAKKGGANSRSQLSPEEYAEKKKAEKEIENALAMEAIAAGETHLTGAHLSAENGELRVQTI